MTSRPFLSIVMNGFNSAAYLREALDSVMRQTFEDWELIFWDNQSEDQTEALVRERNDQRIQFHRSPRRMSLAEGRNEAIARARGEWIAFLDCDDLWADDKLERQINRLKAHPGESVGLVYARTESFSIRGSEGETTYRYTGRPLPEGDIVKSMLLEGNLVPVVSAMVSREAVDAVGPIPPQFTFAEDYYLFTAVAERFKALCVQQTCCQYRVHENSATANNKLTSHREGLAVVERFAHLLEPDELRARQRIYGTLIGIEMCRQSGQRLAGIAHFVRYGSPLFAVQGLIRTCIRRWIHGRRPHS